MLEDRLRELLIPKDPNDVKDVILEIKAGEGGDESALFAGDLLRMYLRYAERQGWQTEVLDDEETDLGGHKSVTVAVRSRSVEQPVWSRLKYEGGVHRVQRVPVTESQGRIHTSAAGVLVLPEAEDVEVEIDPNDLRIDVYRSSGPGGQSVNTTDSAVRITHVPTGTVVSMQNEKSQLQNREAALRVLRARLLAHAQEQADQDASDARRSQVRTVDRSERVRTYNFAENRIADHRVNFKAYNLDQVLDGALDDVIDALTRADIEAALSAARAQRPGPDAAAGPHRAGRRHRRAGGRRGRPRPGWRPSCCWPTCSAAAAAALLAGPAVSPEQAGRFRELVAPAGDRGAVAAPDRQRAVPAPGARGRARGVHPPAGDRTAGGAGRRLAGARRHVVDLCAGSGAIALAVANEFEVGRVVAVERSEPALRWLRRNAADRQAAGDRPIEVVAGDVADPARCWPSWTGTRGRGVLANPPYVAETIRDRCRPRWRTTRTRRCSPARTGWP